LVQICYIWVMVKLLIIEDDMLLDEAYRRKYSEKYDIRIATDGEGGLKAAKSWEPDIILLDIYLPGKFDGIDVLRELKKDTKTTMTPVLVITNLPDMVERVMVMGADKCFMKTEVDLDLIEETLDLLLEKSKR